MMQGAGDMQPALAAAAAAAAVAAGSASAALQDLCQWLLQQGVVCTTGAIYCFYRCCRWFWISMITLSLLLLLLLPLPFLHRLPTACCYYLQVPECVRYLQAARQLYH